MDRLESEKVVIQSPTSYAGSARRIWKITGTGNPLLRWLIAIPIAVMLVAVAWTAVTAWYLMFGLLLVPWRLLRRGSRRRRQDQLRHREQLGGA